MEKIKGLVTNGLREIGIEPADSLAHGFEIFLHELKKWNRAYNLTSLTNDEDIVTKHFLDSLLYCFFIPEDRWSVGDIGSGAGFPGIPISMARPDLRVTLVEPSRKKCAFLKHIKKTLSLANVEVVESRIEDMGEDLFNIVVTRALFSVAEFVRKAEHCLINDGFLIISKGPKADAELQDLPSSCRYELREINLPGTSLQRRLIKIIINKNKQVSES